MNPIKLIWQTIKFIANDLKTDFQFIVKVVKGEVDLDARWKEINHGFTWVEFLKVNWPLFLACLIVGLTTWFIAAKFYQKVANDYIINNCHVSTMLHEGQQFIMEKVNMSDLEGI